MKYDLLIFDCDGVLVDSEPISIRVYVELLAELGMYMTPGEAIRHFAGRPRTTNLAKIERMLGRPVPHDFVQRYEQRTFAAFQQELEPIPGIVAALDQVPIPVCVASSGELEKVRLTLGRTGLLDRFDGRMYSATEVERGKPYPDIFLLAAERMGITPSRCVVVEDSVPGVQAGVRAGMAVLGYARFSDPEDLECAGARVFFDMSELPRLFHE